MGLLNEFVLPISGLSYGVYEYNFEINAAFLKKFKNAPLKECNLKVKLLFLKGIDFYSLEFNISGTFEVMCDRCTSIINLPVDHGYELLVKFSEERKEEEADLIYVSPEIEEFNVAPYIYEYICLSVPYIKVYNCEEEFPKPCDMVVLERLNIIESKGSNSFWDQLKDIKSGLNN